MKQFSFLYLASLGFALANPVARDERVSYEGYGVYRLPVGDDASAVARLVEDLKLDTWKPTIAPGAFADVVVPPEKLPAFKQQIAGMQDVKVMHENLAVSLAAEQETATLATRDASLAAINTNWFTSYHNYTDHLSYLTDLTKRFPKNAAMTTSGTSLQGNTITGVHIYGNTGGGVKPVVLFHGTVHAREWITTMVVEYLAEALLANYGTDAAVTSFVDKYDFYIFPVVNPDGFIYSQTTDRFWRKNRQTTQGNTCVGHDINRNWPYQWNVAGGSSTDPCADDYRGVSAADTPELQSLLAKLNSINSSQGVKLYIDWHSYSQAIMSPYGYNCNLLPANNNEVQSLLNGTAKAIASLFGTQFETGPLCSTIYPVSGGSIDYVKDVAKADYAITVELRDIGYNGFVIPPDQILPSGQETFEGVKYLLQNIK